MDNDLKTALDSIDARLSTIEEQLGVRQEKKPPSQIKESAEVIDEVIEPVVLERVYSPLELKIRALFKQWPSLLGALFLLVALIYFIDYSITSNWFTHGMRVGILLLLSFSILGLGVYLTLKKKRRAVSQALVCLGCSATLVTLWAGSSHYHLYSEMVKLISIFTTIISCALFAYKLKDQVLITFLISFASLIPIIDFWDRSPNVFFSYFALLDIFTVVALLYLRWSWPILVAAIFNFAVCSSTSNRISFEIFALAVPTVLFLLPWAIIWSKNEENWDRVLVKGSLVAVLGFISLSINIADIFRSDATWIGGLLLLFVATMFMVSSTLVAKKSEYSLGQKLLAIAAGSISIFAIWFATELLFNPHSTPRYVFYLEILMGVSFAKWCIRSTGLMCLLPLAFVFILGSEVMTVLLKASPYPLHAFINLLISTVTVFTTAFILKSNKHQASNIVARCLFIPASIFSLYLISDIYHQIFALSDTAKVFCYITFTLVGVWAIFFSASKWIQKGGGLLILFVVAQIVYLEIWSLNILKSMILFASIGSLLLLGSFFAKSHKSATIE
ncbi:MAG: DUF2339 domain-containing protein [Rhabdochlamydiaceae bacterium]|nr:DUF2339 domain-containing protein [Candidatus Amphrikana amoebophyrae]